MFFGLFLFGYYKKVISGLFFLCQKGLEMVFWGWTGIDLERLERTNGNFVGITWEKLGTFRVVNEGVMKIFGNFVGITFFFVGITWEKVG